MPIVAAVDQSDRARAVLEQARELADVYGVELHVVHVGEQEVTISTDAASPSVDLDPAREAAAEVAADVGDRVLDRDAFQPVGLVGDPAPTLIEYGDDVDAECIVVSARKRSSLGQALFGSVTQSLLLNADRAIVAAPRRT